MSSRSAGIAFVTPRAITAQPIPSASLSTRGGIAIPIGVGLEASCADVRIGAHRVDSLRRDTSRALEYANPRPSDAARLRVKRASCPPMLRVGDAWDIAEACCYLGGPSGKFVTGEVLTVDGGGAMWGELWLTDRPSYFEEREASDPSTP